MNFNASTPNYQDMKVNMHFKQGADVGRATDSVLDMQLDARLMAFAEATEHHLATGEELFVARSKHMNVFTDYKTFISVQVLEFSGEEDGARVVGMLALTEDFTHMDVQPLVINNAI